MNKIALIVNFEKNNALSVATELISLLQGKAQLFCPEEDVALLGVTGKSEDALFSQCPVVAVLGGDGTIIATAKKCAPYKNILIGINIGNLGYLSTIESSSLSEAVRLLTSESIHYDDRYMLRAHIFSGGKETASFDALNEIVINRGDRSPLMDFSAYNENKLVCSYRADGIIMATPTGSTAYSLSAGGPIVSPDADAMLITPICPHMLRARSIVLPPNPLRVVPSCEASVAVDGQTVALLDKGDCIMIEKSPYTARLVHIEELSFYDILQRKLQ